MAVELKLNENENKLIRENDVCLYDGETLKIKFKVNFEFSYFYTFVNNINIGKFRSEEIGVHSTKLKNGVNEILLDFFDEDNRPIKSLMTQVIKRDGIKGAVSLENEISTLISSVDELKEEIRKIKAWMEQIDNERSGLWKLLCRKL